METENKKTEKMEIPFVKPARVGNFKVWRSKMKLTVEPTDEQRKQVLEKSGGRKKAVSRSIDIEQINVSILDGTWHIKIPSTYEMFGMIRDLYGEGMTARLQTIFGNMMYASCVANGYFQQAVNFCAQIYANPSLLSEDDEGHDELMKNVDALIKGFQEWRKAYDAKVAESEPTEEDMKEDQVAEDMIDKLSNGE